MSSPEKEFRDLLKLLKPSEESSKKGEGKDIDNTDGPVLKKNFICFWESCSNVPHEKDVDYVRFFLNCPPIDIKEEQSYFEIDWNNSEQWESNTPALLTPFLISQFVGHMRLIIRSGLKNDYIEREENLTAKVRGRILQSKNIPLNIIPGHKERVYCTYSEYSEDTQINRVLKATLLICREIVTTEAKKYFLYQNSDLCSSISTCLSFMQNVGRDSQPSLTAKRVSVPRGKLFKEYGNAMALALEILELNDTFFVKQETGKRKRLFPFFWIYLPTLFEHYIYGKFNGKVEYQCEGFLDQRADFIVSEPSMVIDAKYKEWYKWDEKDQTNKNKGYFRDDIREISGYARDTKMFPNLEKEPDCIIVYPLFGKPKAKRFKDKQSPFDLFNAPAFEDFEKIEGLRDFYKIGIRIPYNE